MNNLQNYICSLLFPLFCILLTLSLIIKFVPPAPQPKCLANCLSRDWLFQSTRDDALVKMGNTNFGTAGGKFLILSISAAVSKIKNRRTH